MVWIKKNPGPDQFVFDAIEPIITPALTQIMLIITFFGKHVFLIPANLLLILYFLLKKENKAALQVLFISLSSLSVMSLTKRLLQRHRPSDPLVDGVTNYSFPSGHAFMCVAFFGLLIWYISQKKKIKFIEKAWIASLTVFILVIGFSRIYLRLHYTTDVIGGFCLGTLWLSFCLWWTADKSNPENI
ncbi:MAG TPA: phosphatase PAP2 family protein [Chitinophagaceae bacterium]|nr:phosphatase PAP2 family protein [Chitinophagaceae bacterium]